MEAWLMTGKGYVWLYITIYYDCKQQVALWQVKKIMSLNLVYIIFAPKLVNYYTIWCLQIVLFTRIQLGGQLKTWGCKRILQNGRG